MVSYKWLSEKYWESYGYEGEGGGGGGDEEKRKKGTWHGNKILEELPHQLQNLKNTKLFRRKLKLFLTQQTYSVEKYLYYEVLT